GRELCDRQYKPVPARAAAAERLRLSGDIVRQEFQGNKTAQEMCPRPYKPLPYHRPQVFRRFASVKPSGRSWARILRAGGRAVNERWELEADSCQLNCIYL